MENWTFRRLIFLVVGFAGLAAIYVGQRYLFYDPLQDYVYNPIVGGRPDIDALRYIGGKLLRYMLNDGFAMMVIHAFFPERKYLKLAFYVFAFGLMALLPVYFVAVFYFFEQVFPYLNHIHRLVLNPVLMLMLIPDILYQKKTLPS